MSEMRLSRRGLLAFAAASGISACSGDRPTLSNADQRTVTQVEKPPAPTVQPVSPQLSSVDQSLVAQAQAAQIDIYDEPDATEPVLTLDNPISSGGPLVFLVDEVVGDTGWLKVLLPVRPNGSTGFIRADDIGLGAHNYRISVEIDRTNLKVTHEGRLFFETRVAVAAENRPTPGGRYYLTELLQPPEPDSIYGTLAYGLSGYSEVLETFNGGPGQLGIHGTNDPDSIGKQVSSGCVRMVNPDIDYLATFLPLGTPVEIFA